MGASLGLIGTIEKALDIESVRTLTKNISYSEVEKLVDSYVFSLTNDIKEELGAHLGSTDLALTSAYIKKHFVTFKHRLLQFFLNHQ
ncbi:MAG: hypothetical protein V1845_01935 [bacterium]